jgi:hypothetical protein
MEMMTIGGQVVALSAYAMIVERLARDDESNPKKILQLIQTPWRSDMTSLFRGDCGSEKIPIPAEDELPELLRALWDSFNF